MRGLRTQGLARNGALAALDALVGILAIFLSYRLVLADHGREAIGLWALVVGVTGVARLADVSGGGALARLVAVAEADGDRPHVLALIDTVTLALMALYAVVLALVYLPLQAALGLMLAPEMLAEAARLLVLAMAVLFATVLGSATAGALDGLQRADLRAVITIAAKGVFLLIALLAIPSQGVAGLALARLAEGLVIVAGARGLLMRLLPGLGPLPRRWRAAAWREAFSYGARLQLWSMAVLAFEPAVRVVLNAFAGLAVLGTYEMAARYVDRARGIVLAAAMPLVPAFAERDLRDRGEAAGLLRRANGVLMTAAGGVMVAVILGAPVLSHLLFGAADPLFLTATALLIPAYLAHTQAAGVHLFARGVGILRWNIAGQGLTALAAASLAAAAGAALGPVAAIAGVAAGMLCGTVLELGGNLRHFQLRPAEVFDLRLWAVSSVVVAVAGLALVFAASSN